MIDSEQQGQQPNPNPNPNPNLYSQDAGSILWEIYSRKTKGIFRKKILSESHTYITDKRIVHNNQEIPLQEISDVVILNRHSASQAQMTHYSYRYSNMRSGVGDIKSKSW
jgi:hypothetical protein